MPTPAKSNTYVQHNNPELLNPETFTRNWYDYRDAQIFNWMTSNPYSEVRHFVPQGYQNLDDGWFIFKYNPFTQMNNGFLLNLAKKYRDDKISSMREYLPEQAIRMPEIRKAMLDKYSLWNNRNNVSDDDLISGFKNTHIYFPEHNTVVYGSPEIMNNGPIKMRVHGEALEHQNNSSWDSPIPYGGMIKLEWNPGIDHTMDRRDLPNEVKSRLMQLRYENRLDPTHKYSIDEIRQMRLDPKFKDFDILNRYNDETVLDLLNIVAQNNHKNPYKVESRVRV